LALKIALVLTTRWWRGSIDHDGYASALRELGHEPTLVCLGNDAGEARFPVVVASPDDYSTAEFWRSLDLEVAIVWNWLRGSRVVKAISDAGIKTILRGDTDGLASKRVFPFESLQRFVGSGVGLRSRLGLAKYFALHSWPQARHEDEELLRTLNVADAIAVETPIARKGICQVLRHYGKSQMATKLRVVPHSVRDDFVSVAVKPAHERKRQVVAAGRWDSTQKNPELLVKTVERVLHQDRRASVVVCGAASDSTRSALNRLGDRVRYAGRVSVDAMINYLNESQLFLSTSRWETHPIGALEALCLGCTVVAPPIRGFIDLLSDSKCGRLAKSMRPADLASAVIAEFIEWESGKKSVPAISEDAREQFCNRTVVNAILRSVRR
jgi:glycosyltransferase involved in cell wall biosynthesis